ncbi:MAG: hypothetical protein U0792_04540 [Gemmataceae bacterium]
MFEDGDRREVFTLLPDVYVFAVNAPDTISIPVDDKLTALLNHANLADFITYGARWLPRPGPPKRGFDYEKTLARVKSLRIEAPPHTVYALAPAPHPAKPRAKSGKK